MRRPLPRVWSGRFSGIAAEADICPTDRGRLYAKLLVFESHRNMNAFWKKLGKFGKDNTAGRTTAGRTTAGIVQMLAVWREKFVDGKLVRRYMAETDPRYFCIIALIRKHLSMRFIAHEAVHAGFCYAKRVKGRPWWAALECDEEAVAYPAGEIAAKINRFLYRKKLYT